MENDKKLSKIYIYFGVITGFVLIGLFLFYFIFNLFLNRILAFIPTLILVLSVIIAQFKIYKVVKGEITFGNLFAAGFKTACASIAIYLLFLIIFSIFVPSFFRKGSITFFISRLILHNLIVGFIASLIGAYSTRVKSFLKY